MPLKLLFVKYPDIAVPFYLPLEFFEILQKIFEFCSNSFVTPPPRLGARETIYWDPKEVKACIVTCGGLCPGLNDVVLGLVKKLEDYGVRIWKFVKLSMF